LVRRYSPGSTFAQRFRIVAYLGQGSMGSVYRAELLESGQVVALKIVNLGVAQDPRALRRFEREAGSGSRIASPYVARTLDSGTLEEGSIAWLAMEFAEGESFDTWLRARPQLSATEARRVLAQLFSAMAVAHAAGIVHRDLKPENVRVSGDAEAPSVKLLDFGIAKDFGIDTLSGTTPGLGTPLWTAPEQAREGYAPLPSADVWALGLLTFFALTGVPYWRHAGKQASMADLALELLRGEIEPASRRSRELGTGAKLPVGFDTWFSRAVHRDPAQRFSDAAEAWQALEPLLGGSAERRNRGPVLPRPAVFLTLVILSCVAAGLAIFWLLRSARI
jgi:eukaryotic-like serine/threonine-protein kinase